MHTLVKLSIDGALDGLYPRTAQIKHIFCAPVHRLAMTPALQTDLGRQHVTDPSSSRKSKGFYFVPMM